MNLLIVCTSENLRENNLHRNRWLHFSRPFPQRMHLVKNKQPFSTYALIVLSLMIKQSSSHCSVGTEADPSGLVCRSDACGCMHGLSLLKVSFFI